MNSLRTLIVAAAMLTAAGCATAPWPYVQAQPRNPFGLPDQGELPSQGEMPQVGAAQRSDQSNRSPTPPRRPPTKVVYEGDADQTEDERSITMPAPPRRQPTQVVYEGDVEEEGSVERAGGVSSPERKNAETSSPRKAPRTTQQLPRRERAKTPAKKSEEEEAQIIIDMGN